MRATSELAAQVGRRPDERPAGPTSLTGSNPANTFSHANSEAKRVHHAEIANEQFLLLKHAILSLHSTTWFGPRLLLQPVPADQFRKPIDLVSPCWRTDAHRLLFAFPGGRRTSPTKQDAALQKGRMMRE